MRVFVTGATGFMGTYLCESLRQRGDAVIAIGSRDADLRRPDALAPWRGERCDRIYHLAAWTQAGDFCLHHPGEQWLINQAINTHVLAWWQEFQPQAKLIAMGTSCSYAPDAELTEENYMLGTPIESLYTYAMTKRMLYVGLQALHKQFGLRYLYLVPSTLYGPGYHAGNKQMHFIFDLIRKIVRARRDGSPPVLWGDGYQKRELIHARDFIAATLALGDAVDNDLVNIGGGREYTIREIAAMICAVVGYDEEMIQYDTSRYVGARSKVLNVAKLHRLLPGHRFVPLAEGLSETVKWFAAQGPGAGG